MRWGVFFFFFSTQVHLFHPLKKSLMATFIPGSTLIPFSNEEADSSQGANSSDDSLIDWRSDDSDDVLKESTHVEGELCETFSNSDEDEDIILEEDIVAEQAMKFSSGHFYSSEDSDTTTAVEEHSGSAIASNEVAESIDQNTRGSCFNENVKDLFFEKHMFGEWPFSCIQSRKI